MRRGATKVVFRSAVTGRFVTERCYIKKPRTTFRDTIILGRQRKRKVRRRSSKRGRR
jgi:hypothetical protein